MNTDNKIIFDYLSFSTRIDSVESICDLLGLKEEIRSKMQDIKGFYGYRHRMYFDGISIHFDGRTDMGICLEMSGKGCRNFEQFGHGNYDLLFDHILNNPEVNITRLDIAYDDFNSILDLDVLIQDVINENYVSRFREFPVESVYSREERRRSQTLYCGSRKSEIMFRIYDKKAEQQSELDHWVRFEMQLRRDRANSFLELLSAGNSLSDLFCSVINNYFRIVEPSETDSNLWRAPIKEYWANFIKTLHKTSLFKPATSYDESNLERYVKSQCSSAIVAFIALVGFENFVDFIKGRSLFKLNPRHEQVLQSHNIFNLKDIFNDLQAV